MPILLLFALIAMSVAIKGYSDDVLATKTGSYERNIFSQAKTVSIAVHDYMLQTGDVPDSLALLAATPGYEYVTGLIDSRIGYAKVVDINGERWKYNRAVVYAQDPLEAVDDATYITSNECGVDITDATGFCGLSNSWYVVVETNEMQMSIYQQLSLGLDDTLYRVIKGYDSGMPNTLSDSTELSLGEATYLTDIVGYTGAASDCQGSFLFEEAILTCADLFSLEGEKVSYFYVSKDEVYVGVNAAHLTGSATGEPEFLFRGM